jgi:hypothetical protein
LDRSKPALRKEMSDEPAWKAFRALSTDERAGGSWRDA